MAAYSTVSSKGQVTIPIEVRRRLGLKEGDRVEFVEEDGVTALRAAPLAEKPRSSFADWIGAYPAFNTREEIHAWISEMRDDDRE